MTGPQWVAITEHLQAWRVSSENLREVAAWCTGRAGEIEQCVDFPDARDAMSTADVGDWVVRGPAGFFALPDDAMRRHYTLSGPPPEEPTRGVLTGETLRITRKGRD